MPPLQSGNQDIDRNLRDEYLSEYGANLRRFLKRLAIGVFIGAVFGLVAGVIIAGTFGEIGPNWPMVVVFTVLGGLTGAIAIWIQESQGHH